MQLLVHHLEYQLLAHLTVEERQVCNGYIQEPWASIIQELRRPIGSSLAERYALRDGMLISLPRGGSWRLRVPSHELQVQIMPYYNGSDTRELQ
jgi:hypothetical protein